MRRNPLPLLLRNMLWVLAWWAAVAWLTIEAMRTIAG
jgi:hypothetical protein